MLRSTYAFAAYSADGVIVRVPIRVDTEHPALLMATIGLTCSFSCRRWLHFLLSGFLFYFCRFASRLRCFCFLGRLLFFFRGFGWRHRFLFFQRRLWLFILGLIGGRNTFRLG